MAVSSNYSLEAELALFFDKVAVTRTECDDKARQLVGGRVIPVPIQGVCSYTVYAGWRNDKVVQFRLRSLALPLETVHLARQIHGSLVPQTTAMGCLGGSDDKQDVLVYVLDRAQGITRLEFILACPFSEASQEYRQLRLSLLKDIGCFFAQSWNNPQEVPSLYKERLHVMYIKELGQLVQVLSEDFQPLIERCLAELDAIMDLPQVLLHKDFGDCNIMVHPQFYQLTGVIDWAEAEICPFGQNLHRIEHLMGKVDLKTGWHRLVDHAALSDAFWTSFLTAAIGVTGDMLHTIKTARVMGVLLAYGFTKRLANMPEPVPIGDDELGRYNKRYMHGLLVQEGTKLD
ncbi:Hypothetical protein D9617_56g096200 [Elsinoe fawcettii]|nr:Hypothetical protein D9617_56g096200 [Elsinoe fawcettii]